MTETKRLQVLIHTQGNQFAVLNEDGSPRVMMSHSPCAPVVGIDLMGLSAYAAFNPLQPCPGLEVRTAYDFCGSDKDGGCQPAAIGHDLPVMVAGLDLRREVSNDPKRRPEAARELHPALAPNRIEAGMAELLKTVEYGNTLAPLAGNRIGACVIENQVAHLADPRALLSSLTKKKKYGFKKMVAAPANDVIESRATFAEAKETMAAIETQHRVTSDLFLSTIIPAARGATAYYFCQAAVPFQVQQRL